MARRDQVLRVRLSSGEEATVPLGTFTAEGRDGLGDVRCVAKWWGFELHLDQRAVDQMQGLRGVIEEVLGRFLPSGVAELVSLCALLQDEWIKRISGGFGVKLVSPWISPSMLIPICQRPANDTHLWWTVFEPSEGWSEDQKFTDHRSKSNPALAVYRDKLTASTAAMGTTSCGGPSTTPRPAGARIRPCPTTPATPVWPWRCSTTACTASTAAAAIVSCGTPPIRPRTAGAPTGPWAATTATPAPRWLSTAAGCTASTRGNDDKFLWWTTFDGSTWHRGQKFGNHRTDSNPALAVYRDTLYALYKGDGTNALYTARFNGNSWDSDSRLPNHASQEGPALAVFQDRLDCVHRDGSDQGLWWTRYDGTNWTTDSKLPNHYSLQGPALEPGGVDEQSARRCAARARCAEGRDRAQR